MRFRRVVLLVAVGALVARVLSQRLGAPAPGGSQAATGGATPDVESATREELYEAAKRLGVRGRSRMRKAELRRAILRRRKQAEGASSA